MKLGDNMDIQYKHLREERNLSQEDIAKVLDVNIWTYRQWELLINDMPIDKCNSLANYYHVSIDYLLGLTDIKQYSHSVTTISPNITGSRITELRKKQKISQVKLAQKLGFTKSSYAYYETGRYIPTTFKLLTIASYYHCSMDYLLGRINNTMIKESEPTVKKEEIPKVRFKELRKKNKLTQKNIGDILEVKSATYHQWETLNNDIPLDICNRLANYYHVSLDYLLGLSNTLQYENYNPCINYDIMRKRLKELRLEYNLNQTTLSKKIGIIQTTYSNYEIGKYLPTTFKLVDIISYYNASMDYILGRINKNNSHN